MAECNNPTSLRGSLRLRLLLGTLGWIALSIVVAGLALGELFSQQVGAQFNAELNTHLDQLVAHLSVGAGGEPTLSAAQSDPRFAKPYSGLYWQIDHLDAVDGNVVGVLRSRSLWDDMLKLPADTLGDGELHRHRLSGPNGSVLGAVERVLTVDGSSGHSFRLVVAADEEQLRAPLEHFNGMLWFALVLLGLGLGLAVVIQVVVALAPLRRLHGALAAVRGGEAPCLEGRFPAEVQPLVDGFNTVLLRNAEVTERARTQTGNLAHALKTPLAVIGNAANGRADEFAQLVALQVDVARRQIDYHLSRSRVAASVRVPGARTVVGSVVDGLMRVMQRIHAERGLQWAVHSGAGTLIFRGEEQDLQEIVGNLLDNACKWAKQRVELSLSGAADELLLIIDDDGPGIAEGERQRVLNRGERADEQVPGSGLGLSIVVDLTRLYGGRIELADSPLGGLRVLLTLPAAASP